MAALPRVVPWVDWDEWLLVWNHLFSSAVERKVIGLNMVAMWRQRGKLPHAIDSTAQLINVSYV